MTESGIVKMYERLPMSASTRERLEAYSMPVTETGCQIWLGSTRRGGYGHMTVAQKSCMAHRLAYEEYVGPIPEGLFVCHRCDTPSCINPDHLFLGTNQDNLSDMVAKGRNVSGAKRPLRDEDVLEMCGLLRETRMEQADIASRFDISQAMVSRINHGNRRQNLTGARPSNPIRKA